MPIFMNNPVLTFVVMTPFGPCIEHAPHNMVKLAEYIG